MDKYILFLISFMFSQATFQALEMPQDIQALSMSNASGAFSTEQSSSNPATIINKNKTKGFNSAYYPGNILFLNMFANKVHKKGIFQVSLSNLYFGRLFDQATQYEFYANDFLLNISYKNIYKEKISYGATIKYLYSDIDTYSAHVLALSVGLRAKVLDGKIGFGTSLENFGIIPSDYTDSYTNTLPSTMRMATHYKLKYLPASIFIDYLLQLRETDNQTIYGIKFQPNDKMLVMLSASSYKKDLKVNALYKDMLSGIAMGVRINLNNKLINMSWKNLGPAGNCFGVGITF